MSKKLYSLSNTEMGIYLDCIKKQQHTILRFL